MFNIFKNVASASAVSLAMALPSVAGEVNITDDHKACISTVVQNLYSGKPELRGNLENTTGYSTKVHSESAIFTSTAMIRDHHRIIFQTVGEDKTFIPNGLRSAFGFPVNNVVAYVEVDLITGNAQNSLLHSDSDKLNKATVDNNARLVNLSGMCFE